MCIIVEFVVMFWKVSKLNKFLCVLKFLTSPEHFECQQISSNVHDPVYCFDVRVLRFQKSGRGMCEFLRSKPSGVYF
jgi:hypothetical protein